MYTPDRRCRGGRVACGNHSFLDWITQIVSEYGYPGIVLLMLGENIFPPLTSELIMPLAGFVAAQGQLNPVLVVLAGTLGSVLGALPWCYAGRRLVRWSFEFFGG